MENIWDETDESAQNAGTIRTNEPRVTLNKRGDLTINQLAYGQLKNPNKVMLGYVKSKNIITIRPAKEEEKGYSVRPLRNSTSYIVRSAHFTNFHNIKPPQTVKFEGMAVDDIGMLLDLSKGTFMAFRKADRPKEEQPKKIEQPKPVESNSAVASGVPWYKK